MNILTVMSSDLTRASVSVVICEVQDQPPADALSVPVAQAVQPAALLNFLTGVELKPVPGSISFLCTSFISVRSLIEPECPTVTAIHILESYCIYSTK